jgi:hypothetical protein
LRLKEVQLHTDSLLAFVEIGGHSFKGQVSNLPLLVCVGTWEHPLSHGRNRLEPGRASEQVST